MCARRAPQKSNAVVPMTWLESQSSSKSATNGFIGSKLTATGSFNPRAQEAGGARLQRASVDSRTMGSSLTGGSGGGGSLAPAEPMRSGGAATWDEEPPRGAGNTRRMSADGHPMDGSQPGPQPSRRDSNPSVKGVLTRMLMRAMSTGGAEPGDAAAFTSPFAPSVRLQPGRGASEDAGAPHRTTEGSLDCGVGSPNRRGPAPAKERSSLKSVAAIRTSSVGVGLTDAQPPSSSGAATGAAAAGATGGGSGAPTANHSTILDFQSNAWEAPCPVPEEDLTKWEFDIFRVKTQQDLCRVVRTPRSPRTLYSSSLVRSTNQANLAPPLVLSE